MNSKEAAIAWINTKDMDYQSKVNWPDVMRGAKNRHCIVELWMQEVVLPWWNSQHFSYRNLINASHAPEGVTNEGIADLYLAEKTYWENVGKIHE